MQSQMTLEEKTRAYWRVSMGWNGKAKPVTMDRALKTTCEIICSTSPTRRLSKLTEAMEREMINHQPARKRKEKEA